ncbi:MAG: SDR family oxidoreductase [Saprospirales bacterium]|nr:MAG: SDR family oxidoreductase [Saprospirales bacterium]
MEKQKTALITGGTKGIGYGIAQVLLENGWNIGITGSSENSVNSAMNKLSNSFGKDRIAGYICDVRDGEAQIATVDQLVGQFGGMDMLVANAGVGHFADIGEMTTEQWNEVIDVNLTGVFHSIKAGLGALKESKGFFITIASLAGTNFFARGAAYCASKFGLVGFTQAVMLDLREHGIRTSTIMPGSVATHFNGNQPGPKDDWKIQPEDIGQMVLQLYDMDPRTLPSKIEVRPSMPPKR